MNIMSKATINRVGGSYLESNTSPVNFSLYCTDMHFEIALLRYHFLLIIAKPCVLNSQVLLCIRLVVFS